MVDMVDCRIVIVVAVPSRRRRSSRHQRRPRIVSCVQVLPWQRRWGSASVLHYCWRPKRSVLAEHRVLGALLGVGLVLGDGVGPALGEGALGGGRERNEREWVGRGRFRSSSPSCGMDSAGVIGELSQTGESSG